MLINTNTLVIMTRKLASLLLLHLIAPVAFAVQVGREEPPEAVVNANLPSANQQQQFAFDKEDDRNLQQTQCNTSTSTQFTANILVDLRGLPRKLMWKERKNVGTVIMDAYNELVNCGTGGPFRQITSVQVKPFSFDDDDDANEDDEEEETFTLNYAIQGSCKGCTVSSSGTARLFTYHDRNGGGASAFSDPCPCVGPSIFSFRVLLKQRIELLILSKLTAGNIIGLVQVSEIENSPSCQDIQTFTSSSVVIEFYGCPSALEEWEFLDVGEKFVKVYNRINGKKARLCDPFFREIVSAIPILDGGNITDVPSARDRARQMVESPDFMTTTATAAAANDYTRALQAADDDGMCDEYFEVRYEITAVCRNCDLDKITLFDEPDAVNFLEGDDNDDSVRSLNTADYGTAHKEWDSRQGYQEDEEKRERRSLSGSSKCQCPLDTSFRAVTEDEMTAAFAVSISRSTSLQVEDVVEIFPIPCNPDVETFETFVDIEYEFESEDGTVPQEAAAAFVANFLLSYNSLQARYCDPYFREVASAEIADQAVVRSRRDRSLQIRKAASKFTVTIRVNVVGTCRGCSGSTRKLFVVSYMVPFL